MTENSKKKKKTEEVIATWTILKPKLMTTINQNRKLHYLFSCETSLTERRKENQQYEDRLRQTEDKHNKLRAKLERIRGLILENQIDKLKSLLKKGQI